MDYEKIPAYPYSESLKLSRIKDFLVTLDNPQDRLKCIHVAGSKGKGSTCAFVTYILREAGYKVGLYTSPHLSDFRERIRILNSRQAQDQDSFEGMISRKELACLVEELKPAVEKYNKDSKYGPLSFFEVYTALAFIYFNRKGVDLAVLETGLGGRLDATNVINPLVCAITPISYEHTQKLGNTLKEIASEKAGIIKIKDSIVISALQEKEAMEVIRNKCKLLGAKLYEAGRDITYKKINHSFNVKGIFGEYRDLKIRLPGEHQLLNAAVAIGAIEALRAFNIKVPSDSIKNGLYNTVWPARCETISRNPSVVLDGAQNIASARALRDAIKNYFKYKKLILVLGISSDKDIKGICSELHDLADAVVLTRASNPRATDPKILAGCFNSKPVYITKNVKQAAYKSKSLAKKEDLILVTGSLFVAGEFRNE
ncbi:MAG: hypothetical protein A3K83_04220 [Omnitrophica WOR_2 bacterium RBG_13_44_8b]|nr:MAG: hypothetical protein A3K83_04220 [Omnitrophica WOR_2 bacterium RBG_13_44_8b]